MSAETDVARAIYEKFNATSALLTSIPGGLVSDVDDELTPIPGVSTPRQEPYAILNVSEGPARLQDTSGHYIDKRRVEIIVYGKGKAAIGAIVSQLHNTFDNPATLDFSFSSAVVAHLRTEPLEGDERPEPDRKAGEDERRAVVRWLVWTHRTGG